MKHFIYILSLLIFVTGCSPEEATVPVGILVKTTVSTRYANVADTGTQSDTDYRINTLSGYICQDGIVKWVSHDLNKSTDEVEFPSIYQTGTLYLIANKDLCPQASNIIAGTRENELINLQSTISNNFNPSALLMANVVSIGSLRLPEGSSTIHLQRNVARFDLVVDPEVVIHSVSVDGIPAKASVFGSTTTGEAFETVTFNTTFTDESPAVQDALFYCHELATDSQTPVTVTIDASHGSYRAKSQVTINTVKRNFIYRLHVSAPNGIITSDITYADMETGDDVTLDKTEQTAMLIDAGQSTLPANCQVSEDNRRLTFDYQGGQAILALTGTNKKKFIRSTGSIKDFSVTTQADGRFLIKVGTYTSELGTDKPATVMYFAAENETDPARYQMIAVVANYYAPFDIVTMGGTEWMQVNAINANPQSYQATKINADYQDLYKNNWFTYCARGNQWGPRPGDANGNIKQYAAWEPSWGFDNTTLNNANKGIIDDANCKAWNGPCPDGWRLPTSEEFARIWPAKNLVITDNNPVSYTTSYGNFTATIVNQGSSSTAYVSKVELRSIVISNNGHTLVFPIAGCRNNSGIHYEGDSAVFDYLGWNAGKEVYYWCQDRKANKMVTVYGIVNSNTSTIKEDNPVNWNQIRCVRNIKN